MSTISTVKVAGTTYDLDYKNSWPSKVDTAECVCRPVSQVAGSSGYFWVLAGGCTFYLSSTSTRYYAAYYYALRADQTTYSGSNTGVLKIFEEGGSSAIASLSITAYHGNSLSATVNSAGTEAYINICTGSYNYSDSSTRAQVLHAKFVASSSVLTQVTTASNALPTVSIGTITNLSGTTVTSNFSAFDLQIKNGTYYYLGAVGGQVWVKTTTSPSTTVSFSGKCTFSVTNSYPGVQVQGANQLAAFIFDRAGNPYIGYLYSQPNQVYIFDLSGNFVNKIEFDSCYSCVSVDEFEGFHIEGDDMWLFGANWNDERESLPVLPNAVFHANFKKSVGFSLNHTFNDTYPIVIEVSNSANAIPYLYNNWAGTGDWQSSSYKLSLKYLRDVSGAIKTFGINSVNLYLSSSYTDALTLPPGTNIWISFGSYSLGGIFMKKGKLSFSWPSFLSSYTSTSGAWGNGYFFKLDTVDVYIPGTATLPSATIGSFSWCNVCADFNLKSKISDTNSKWDYPRIIYSGEKTIATNTYIKAYLYSDGTLIYDYWAQINSVSCSSNWSTSNTHIKYCTTLAGGYTYPAKLKSAPYVTTDISCTNPRYFLINKYPGESAKGTTGISSYICAPASYTGDTVIYSQHVVGAVSSVSSALTTLEAWA